jgi:hypothetical protein
MAGEMPSRIAALEKLPAVATAMNVLRFERLSIRYQHAIIS